MAARSWPSKSTTPEVGRSRPPRICSRVVFPCPVGPWMASHSPSSMTRSTPASASTVTRPFWYRLVTPVSLYMVSLSVGPCSLDPGQCRGRAEPGGPPAAEGAGDEAAGDGQHHGQDHRADGDRRGEVDGHAVRRVRRRLAEAATGEPATSRGEPA